MLRRHLFEVALWLIPVWCFAVLAFGVQQRVDDSYWYAASGIALLGIPLAFLTPRWVPIVAWCVTTFIVIQFVGNIGAAR